jgi:hypothetical protein
MFANLKLLKSLEDVRLETARNNPRISGKQLSHCNISKLREVKVGREGVPHQPPPTSDQR